jgi:hypothetical protein
MRKLTQIMVFILTATVASSGFGIARGATSAGFVQSQGENAAYSIDQNDLNRALDSTAVCTRTLDVDVKVTVPKDPQNVIESYAKNHEIMLTNGTEILVGANPQLVEPISGVEWQTIVFTLNGCLAPRWKSQNWAMSMTSVVKIKRKNGPFTTSTEGKQSTVPVVFSALPNRQKPAISVLTVMPSKTSATVLMGAKKAKGDPDFTYEYRVSGANTSKFPATWKEATGQVAKITSLKPKATYKLYVRAVAPDGTSGTSKLTSFKTK